MAAYPDIPESVQDSRWEADFEPNSHVPYQTTNTLLTGRRLLRQETWIRQKQLGHGGFGVVWLEKAHSANRSVARLRAVKELRVSREDVRRHECIRELQALVKFSHRKFVGSFVEFYSWYESNDALFIAMEYCRHGDLRQFVKDHGAIVEVDAQKITDQVLQALMFMHENNFAHRDLKPANILIQRRPPDNEWKIKVGDMGLSKRIDIEASSTTVRGTPGFIAPERVPGIGSNPSTTDPFPCDMWCLGEVAFFLLTGEKTFDSPTQLHGYYNGTKSFPDERLQAATIRQEAIDFIKALMAAQPSRRLSAFEADYHSWMSSIDTSEMADHGKISNTTPDPHRSSKLSAVDELPEILNDTSLNELTARGLMVPDPPRHGTDTQSVASGSWDTATAHEPSHPLPKPKSEHPDLIQRTTSVASGTWNSSATPIAPELGDDELAVVKSSDHGSETGVQSSDDEDDWIDKTEEYRPDTRPVFSKKETYRIDEKGVVWTVTPQIVVRDDKTGRARRLVKVSSTDNRLTDFQDPDAYETVEEDSDTTDDDVVRYPLLISRKRKYELMLEAAIEYINRTREKIPKLRHERSEERLRPGSVPTAPEIDDVDDEDVFWSDDEERRSDRRAKKFKRDAGSGSEMDIDKDRRSRSPRDAEAHAPTEEVAKQFRVRYAPQFDERDISYSDTPSREEYRKSHDSIYGDRNRTTPSPRNLERQADMKEETRFMPHHRERKYAPQFDERDISYSDLPYNGSHRNEVYGMKDVVQWVDEDGRVQSAPFVGGREIHHGDMPSKESPRRRSRSPRDVRVQEVEAHRDRWIKQIRRHLDVPYKESYRSNIDRGRMTRPASDVEVHTGTEEIEYTEPRRNTRQPRRDTVRYVVDMDEEKDEDQDDDRDDIARYGSDASEPSDGYSHKETRSRHPITISEFLPEDDAFSRTVRWVSATDVELGQKEEEEKEETASNYKPPTVEDAPNSD